MALARTHRDLQVYCRAFEAAMLVFEESKTFPKHEMYSLTDQIRRSSRSVAANLAEAWRKRRYRAAFVNKLSDAETEAAETQVWIEFAEGCGYWEATAATRIASLYDDIIRTIVSMMSHADDWALPPASASTASRTRE